MVVTAGLKAGGGIGRARSLAWMGWTGVANAGLEEGMALSSRRNELAMGPTVGEEAKRWYSNSTIGVV